MALRKDPVEGVGRSEQRQPRTRRARDQQARSRCYSGKQPWQRAGTTGAIHRAAPSPRCKRVFAHLPPRPTIRSGDTNE
jgi:hypothetical protein